MNPNMQIIRGLPSQKDLIQSQLNPLTGMYEAKPVTGALAAKVATTLPEVPVGAQLSMTNAGLLQTNLLPNMRTVQQQLAFDKRFGEGQAALQTTPTNVVVPVAEADSPRSNSLFTPVNPETVKPFGVTVIAVESDEAAR
jgi:hypothetical protein